MARLQQQKSSDDLLAAQQSQAVQVQAALAAMAAQANQPSQVAQQQQPAGEPSFAEKLARMSPAERAAWDEFAAGISQPQQAAPLPAVGPAPSAPRSIGPAPAPAPVQQWPYRQNLPAVTTPAPQAPRPDAIRGPR